MIQTKPLVKFSVTESNNLIIKTRKQTKSLRESIKKFAPTNEQNNTTKHVEINELLCVLFLFHYSYEQQNILSLSLPLSLCITLEILYSLVQGDFNIKIITTYVVCMNNSY